VHYLCDEGLLVEVPFGNGASLYDARTDRHDHALCTGCGTIVDYDCTLAPTVAAQAAQATGFANPDVRVIVTGLCPTCRPTA
jgi:Fe2+ or Zn2+ uptake regulation protein